MRDSSPFMSLEEPHQDDGSILKNYLGLAPLKAPGTAVGFDDPNIVLANRVERDGVERVLQLIEAGDRAERRRVRRLELKSRKDKDDG